MGEQDPPALRAGLEAEARRRFGPARAEALAPELEALAADLAAVAAAPLPDDAEPGFFLLSEGPDAASAGRPGGGALP
jgi:hypothetical protein